MKLAMIISGKKLEDEEEDEEEDEDLSVDLEKDDEEAGGFTD